jgi:hypothetical protein
MPPIDDTTPESNDNAEVATDARGDDIAKAFDQHEQAETTTEAAEAPATESTSQDEGTSGRDALGRFAPKRDTAKADAQAEAPAAKPDGEAAAAPAEGEAQPQVKHTAPPASWKPEERQHWEKVPIEAREAVMRREVEINRAMQETVTARRGIEAIQRVIAPYVPNITAAGGDAVTAIKTFFDYDNRLRHGTQMEKAKALTALIKGYGVDIEALDAELAGAPHNPATVQQDAVKAALERELAPFRAYLQQQQAAEQQRRAQENAAIDTSVEQFASDPANRYFAQVRGTMADLLDVAAAQGRQLTLKDAYDQAVWSNPETRSMLLKEQLSSTAQNRNAAAQRAKNAAVSVKGSSKGVAPSVAEAAEGSRVDAIRAAFDAAEGQA